MSERYTRLFALPGNLYAEGSPVVLAAGALLKDNETGKVLAQLKIKNIGGKTIKAAKVRVTPFDTVGKPLGEETDHQYLDLDIGRDKEFGQKVAIELPDASTRSFSVEVTEIDFADNSVWAPSGAEWEPLPKQTELAGWLKDAELEKQYQLEYGKDCKYALLEVKDLWLCPCGEINRQGETSCQCCEKRLPDLKAVDLEKLKADRDTRLAAEAQKREEERQERERIASEAKATAAARAKKTKKLAAILGSIALLFVAAIVLLTSPAKKKGAEAEAEFMERVSVSMLEAQELIDGISSPSSEAEKLIEICEKYAPYCGTYTWLNMSGTAHKEFSFVSDFYIENGKVFWVYDDSAFSQLHSLTGVYANPEHASDPEYIFLQSPLAVEDMRAYERVEDDMMDMTIVFKDEKVIITMGYFENYIQGSEFVVTNSHHDAFTLEAIKGGAT